MSTTTRRGRLLFRARPRARYSLPSFLALSFRLCSSTKTYAKPTTLAFDASNVTRTSRKTMRAITKNVFFSKAKRTTCLHILDGHSENYRFYRAFLRIEPVTDLLNATGFRVSTRLALPLSAYKISSPFTRHSPQRSALQSRLSFTTLLLFVLLPILPASFSSLAIVLLSASYIDNAESQNQLFVLRRVSWMRNPEKDRKKHGYDPRGVSAKTGEVTGRETTRRRRRRRPKARPSQWQQAWLAGGASSARYIGRRRHLRVDTSQCAF